MADKSATVAKKLLYWLVVGSRGGANRARILMLLKERPMNTQQISDALALDYKTVQHHLDLLKKNTLLDNVGEGYGKGYTLSPDMEAMADELPKLFKIRKK